MYELALKKARESAGRDRPDAEERTRERP